MLKINIDTNIINLSHGAEILGGNINEAKNILAIFINEQLPQDKIAIMQYYKEKNYKKLLEFVHGLHGATCFCGVPALQIAAASLENDLRTTQKNIDLLYTNLLNEIDKLKNEFEKL